jgi:hypothetical protein
MADACDASVADGERRGHAVARVHREEAAVDEVYVQRAAARDPAVIAIPIVVIVVAPARTGREWYRCRGGRTLDESAARKAPALFVFAHVLSLFASVCRAT